MSLDDLARRYGTDKSSAGHNYCWIYERHLSHYCGRPLRLLELGVKNGASLRMWRDYFKYAQIIGADIDPACSFREQRIAVYTGNQADTAFLHELHHQHGPFDVVIDDASHCWSHCISTIETLLPLVVAGGFYVVEDTQCSYWDSYRKGAETTLKRLYRLVDELTNQQVFTGGTGQDYMTGIYFYPNICFIERKKD